MMTYVVSEKDDQNYEENDDEHDFTDVLDISEYFRPY